MTIVCEKNIWNNRDQKVIQEIPVENIGWEEILKAKQSINFIDLLNNQYKLWAQDSLLLHTVGKSIIHPIRSDLQCPLWWTCYVAFKEKVSSAPQQSAKFHRFPLWLSKLSKPHSKLKGQTGLMGFICIWSDSVVNIYLSITFNSQDYQMLFWQAIFLMI